MAAWAKDKAAREKFSFAASCFDVRMMHLRGDAALDASFDGFYIEEMESERVVCVVFRRQDGSHGMRMPTPWFYLRYCRSH